MALFPSECCITSSKSYDIVRMALRIKIGHLMGSSLVQVASSSKKHSSFESSRKSKGSVDTSSIKKLNIASLRDATPRSIDNEFGHLRTEEGGSKSKPFNLSREKDETIDYRLKSDTVHRLDPFVFEEEGEDDSTKRMDENKDTPRLINFSINSLERSPGKEVIPQQDQSIDKWMAAAGMNQMLGHRYDHFSNQETKRANSNILRNDGINDQKMFRELPAPPHNHAKQQEHQEEFRFIQTGITDFLADGDCISTPRLRQPYKENIKLQEIDKMIDELDRSKDRISKSSYPLEYKDEKPNHSRVTPTKQPSPPSKNIFNHNAKYCDPVRLADHYTIESNANSRPQHSIGSYPVSMNYAQTDSEYFHTFKNGVSNNSEKNTNHKDKPQVLMSLVINDVELKVYRSDNSEKLARKYFEAIQAYPAKKDLAKLKALISEKVNKKIDYLEKFFKRSITKNESQTSLTAKSVSIDLSNKENFNPNMPQEIAHKLTKPPLMDRKQSTNTSNTQGWKNSQRSKFSSNSTAADDLRSGYAAEISRRYPSPKPSVQAHQPKPASRPKPPPPAMTFTAKSNKHVDINVKKDDDPNELARIILLQRGLSLSNVDKLAGNIRQFQIKTYGVKNA